MSWYRLYCDSGPGHQSHHESYKWISDDDSDKAGLQEAWDYWARDWYDAVGGIDKVAYLPEKWHARLVDKYKLNISNSRKMLAILKRTPQTVIADKKKKAGK